MNHTAGATSLRLAGNRKQTRGVSSVCGVCTATRDPAFFLSSRDRRLASNTKQSHHRPTRQKWRVGDGAAGGGGTGRWGGGGRTLITTVAKGRKANEVSRRSGVVSACLPAAAAAARS